jgi:hypothetical protein
VGYDYHLRHQPDLHKHVGHRVLRLRRDSMFPAGHRLPGHADSGDLHEGHGQLLVRVLDVDVYFIPVLLGESAKRGMFRHMHG